MTYANKSARELANEKKAAEAAKAPAPKQTTTTKK
jgi:hypothetical protein